MDKTLFEKLTGVAEDFTLQQSVTQNIDRILCCGGFLDAATGNTVDSAREATDNIFRHALPSAVDQSMGNEEQQAIYRATLAKLILRFEPRLKNVTVNNVAQVGLRSSCRLKIELVDGEFEQEFVFGQI
ncbi:MAG: putative component of type VI protein secretion system [Phenylobacterium sp.]|jgi:predicted component of type VI protein secretion system